MLTKKQKELYDYLRSYISKSNISPSFEEMKVALGLKSKSGIHRLITSLEQRGFIKRLKHKARAMEIIKKSDESSSESSNNEILIPLAGNIPAGTPSEAISSSNEKISVPSSMVSKNHEYFGLIVKGESMIEEGIMDGDIAILKHSKSVNNGKIAAVLIKGEDVTLKKLKLHDTTVKLIPANPSYKEKTYSAAEIEVQGELKGLIRKYN